jgi:hypothetical protein
MDFPRALLDGVIKYPGKSPCGLPAAGVKFRALEKLAKSARLSISLRRDRQKTSAPDTSGTKKSQKPRFQRMPKNANGKVDKLKLRASTMQAFARRDEQ